MNDFLKKYLLRIIGVLIGSISGFLYYYFVGCASGTCPISSNPYISVIYGGFLGYLLFGMFKRQEHGAN